MGQQSTKPPAQYKVQCLKNGLPNGLLTYDNIYQATQKCFSKGDKNTAAFPRFASFFGSTGTRWDGKCLKSKFPTNELSITTAQIKSGMPACAKQSNKEGFSYNESNIWLFLVIAIVLYMIYTQK